MKLGYLLAIIGALVLPSAVRAQSTATPVAVGHLTTSGCPGAVSVCWVPFSVSDPLPVSATVTGFAPNGTPSAPAHISVTDVTAAATLPAASSDIAVSNIGANLAYIKFGASATTNDLPLPSNSTMWLNVPGGATQLSAIADTGKTTTVGIQGGTGLGSGMGGGSAGGGGAVTVASGADVAEGAIGDAAYAGSGNSTVIAALKGLYAVAAGAIASGSNLIGRTNPEPQTANGTLVFSEIVANNTTSVAVKASAGQIYGIRVFSNNTTEVYGKLYNIAQGSVTCGTPTPQDRFAIPAQTGGSGFVVPIPYGETFSTAITLCVTTGIADNDTGAPAATSYLVSIDYK